LEDAQGFRPGGTVTDDFDFGITAEQSLQPAARGQFVVHD
jgi:hypothetical protein